MKIEDLKKYLDQKFAIIDERFEENNNQFKGVNQQFEDINQQFKGVNQQFKEATQERKSMQEQLSNATQERKTMQIDITKIGVSLESHISDQRDFGPMIAETRREVSSLSDKQTTLMETVSLNRLAISKM